MTQAEWEARVAIVMAEEAELAESWWYLSFADTSGFLGAAIVEARGILSAVQKAHRLGINPGGEVRAIAAPREVVDIFPANKLLSRADLEQQGEVFTWKT